MVMLNLILASLPLFATQTPSETVQTPPETTQTPSEAATNPSAKALTKAPSEADYYQAHSVPVPDHIELEIGGIQPLDDGSLLACTRRGQVWRIVDPLGTSPEFSLWTDGLQEPLGLWLQEGWIYSATRGELLRMRDRSGDGHADDFETINDDWDISGNYHEYNFGPRPDAEGNWWITTNRAFGDQPFGQPDWRGWALRLKPGEDMEPMAAGLRSPAGLELSPWGELFYTDNQGEWCGANKLSVLKEGAFYGHPFGIESAHLPASHVTYPGENPDGIMMPKAHTELPNFQLPAVWFPYNKMGRSASGMAWDRSGGAFGPFAGQLFVGDQYEASVMRVSLEKVSGEWQGACYPFRKGLAAGVIRVRQAEDGGLWVGMSDRGWPSLGTEGYGLQKLTWSGEVPFEIYEMRATPSGFDVQFTKPVDLAEESMQSLSLSLSSYTYELHSAYGSDEMETLELVISSYQMSEDGRTLHLTVDGLREGYVHELHVKDLHDLEGNQLLHEVAYYTLIHIPTHETSQ